jgi:hypothetical protein
MNYVWCDAAGITLPLHPTNPIQSYLVGVGLARVDVDDQRRPPAAVKYAAEQLQVRARGHDMQCNTDPTKSSRNPRTDASLDDRNWT